MNDDTDIFVAPQSAHHENASCRGAEVNRSESTVGTAHTGGFVEVSYKDNGTACPLCDLPDGFHNRPHLVGTVHIHTLSKVSLHRIEDKHLGTALHDGFFNSFVQHMQRFFFLANIDDAFLVCACFYETRLDGIVETVLCRLIDHRYGCNGIHIRQRRSGGAGGGKAEREGCFAFSRIAVYDRQLTEGNIRIPQPIHFPHLDVRHFE